jgi:hypothetical protein
VESEVVLDEVLGRGVVADGGELSVEFGELPGSDEAGRLRRGMRFQHVPHLEDLEHRRIPVQLGDERQRFEEQAWFEANVSRNYTQPSLIFGSCRRSGR